MLRLSQGQLTLLETCPRKFQYVVLDQLSALPSPEQQANMVWGDRFHLLMQQLHMGLPVETLLQGDPALGDAVRSLRLMAPHLFTIDQSDAMQSEVAQSDAMQSNARRIESEHLRSFTLGRHSFSVIYDLLSTTPQQATIIDWKTYPRPRAVQWLAEHWQTRLYCYGLVETSDYQPEQVSMTYWFVKAAEQTVAVPPDQAAMNQENSPPNDTTQESQVPYHPQCLHLPYSQNQHALIHQRLLQSLEQLDVWLADYERSQPLPQVDISKGHCRDCPFAERCARTEAVAGTVMDWMTPDLSSIEEVMP